jgi:hypothetical protein
MPLKDHIPPTLHNTFGTLIAAAIMAGLGVLYAVFARSSSVTLPLWLIGVSLVVIVSAFMWLALRYGRRAPPVGSQPEERQHPRANWGLIVGAIIGAVSLLWVNSRRGEFEQKEGQFEQQIARLKDQVRVLQAAEPTATPISPAQSTPSEAELEKRQLQKEVEALRADAERKRKRTAELEDEIRVLKQELKEKGQKRDQTTRAPEVATTTPTSPSETSATPPPRQKLERFTVEVTRAQTHGDSATVYVRFTSTVSARIKMFLADGFLGHNKTFLVDDSGQHYNLDNSSGIGNCCFGFAGGDWNGAILDLGPNGVADITLTFRRQNRTGELERQPQSLTLAAELTVGDIVKLQSWPSPQWQSSGSAGISIAGIVPH